MTNTTDPNERARDLLADALNKNGVPKEVILLPTTKVLMQAATDAIVCALSHAAAVEGCPHCGGTGGHWEGCRAPIDATPAPAAVAGGEVQFKPLVWRERWGGCEEDIPTWRGENPLGLMVDVCFAGRYSLRYHKDAPPDELAAAKEAAEADYRARVLSALAAHPAAVSAVPEGFVLVPRKANGNMIHAAVRVWDSSSAPDPEQLQVASETWNAMLAAALKEEK